MRGLGNFSDGVEMRISAAANVALRVVEGTMVTLARSGRAVLLGAAGICCAVSVELSSCTVKRTSSGEQG